MSLVQWAYETFEDKPRDIPAGGAYTITAGAAQDILPQAVIPLDALREVVEGLQEIAEPNQEPFATTTDAIRALSATLKMLNAARDKAQRLLASLGEQ